MDAKFSEHKDLRLQIGKLSKILISIYEFKGPLIIYASGWGRREVGWVNDFLGSIRVGI